MGDEKILVGADEITDRAAAVGLSQYRLARLAGIDPMTFYRWRRGITGINTTNYERVMQVLLAAERETVRAPVQ